MRFPDGRQYFAANSEIAHAFGILNTDTSHGSISISRRNGSSAAFTLSISSCNGYRHRQLLAGIGGVVRCEVSAMSRATVSKCAGKKIPPGMRTLIMASPRTAGDIRFRTGFNDININNHDVLLNRQNVARDGVVKYRAVGAEHTLRPYGSGRTSRRSEPSGVHQSADLLRLEPFCGSIFTVR